MKKLMTMIAAVAMSFGLFADPLNNTWIGASKTATDWNEDKLWTGDGLADATFANGALTIKTGTKVVSRQILDDGSYDLATSNLFVETEVDFKDQALDDVPAYDETAKIAIFALDGTEITGAPAGTNLYVMGGYGNGGAALFKILGYNDGSLVEAGVTHKIVVKAYNEADGARSGFAVYVSSGAIGESVSPVRVENVYPIDTTTGEISWNAGIKLADYLGLEGTGITIQEGLRWYAQQSLFLSMDALGTSANKITTLDFKGNADIAKVAFTEEYPGFPEDSQTMTIADGVAITNVTGALAWKLGDTTISGIAGNTINIYPAFAKDIVKVSVNGETISGGEVKQDSYAITFADKATILVEEFDTKATVVVDGGNAIPCKDIAAAITAANGATVAATITLNDAVEMTGAAAEKFTNSNLITLDLAGKAITCSGNNKETIQVAKNAQLLITDSVGTGSVSAGTGTGAAAVGNYGKLAIEKGTFNGLVYVGDAQETTITGGAFDKANNGEDKFALTPADGYIAVGGEGELALYWVVVPKPIDYVTFTVSYDADQVKEVTVTTNNGVAVAGNEGTYTVESNAVVTVAATEQAGYENVSITGDNVTPVAGVFTADKAASAITISASEIKVTEVKLDITSTNVVVGESFTLIATVKSETAKDQTIAWTTSDSAVATVVDGEVTAVAAGTATITATNAASGLFATCTVTVESAGPEIPEVAPGAGPVQVNEEDVDKVVIKATAPAGSGITDEEYTAYFKKSVVDIGEGKVSVSAVLDEEAIEFTESVEDLGEEVSKIAAGAESATIAAKPGLYYYVEEADDVTKIAEPERDRVMATGATVTVPTTKFTGSGFYRLNCSTTQRGMVTGGQD